MPREQLPKNDEDNQVIDYLDEAVTKNVIDSYL